MKNLYQHLFCLLFFVCFQPAQAQTDSIIVKGRIRNFSARLYRESPTVFISRNNILQANRELVRPAPLNADGTFQVALPLIYSQEELYFNYGRISTAFLAAPGTLSIDLDADSLFTAAVPFRFAGVNAQVNSQFTRYKAFESTYPDKPDGKKLSETVADKSDAETYRAVLTAYQKPFQQFATRQPPFLLVSRWIQSANRYNAASFVYDKALYENSPLPVSLTDSLRPPNDKILTAARASAMNRFAEYATQRVTVEVANRSLSVKVLSKLLERYGKDLTEDERTKLAEYASQNTARASDLRFFDRLIRRSPDTLQRLVTYETLMQRGRQQFDSLAVDYLAAYWLASSLPSLTLDFARLLYDYARSQVKDQQLAQSLDELYRLEVKDSTRIRTAVQTLRKAGIRASNLEISPNVFITRNEPENGSTLFDQVINANRGKVIYVLLLPPSEEAGRQAALEVQRLRDAYSSRDVALIYLPMPTTDKLLWPEMATRYNLAGDHLLLTDSQLSDAIQRLRPDRELSAAIISRTSKIVKRNAPLPAQFEEVRKVIDKTL